MARVYVSVGSNIDRERYIRAGLAALRERYGPLQCSRIYESKAVGFDGDDFYNLVVGFDTEQPVRDVAAALREIEQQHARDRRAPRFSARTLDLDLLLYDDLVADAQGLQLPRAEIMRYAFVLGPLAEIANERRHPQYGRRYAELWADFADKAAQPGGPGARGGAGGGAARAGGGTADD